MEQFPLFFQEKSVGIMCIERQGDTVCFSCTASRAQTELRSVWAVGTADALRLGLLMPGKREFCRRFSRQMVSPAGAILRGELRTVSESGAAECAGSWERLNGRNVFRTTLLRQAAGRSDLMLRRECGRITVAFPYKPDAPFPLPELFCFARLEMIGQRPWLLFRFDENERPVF